MRLDELLVQRELCADLHDARASIMAGEVVVGEHRATSAGMRVTDDTAVRLKEGKRRGGFVSRGGLKLQRALDAFAIDVTGLSCVDLGASSGGFTDCLLQRGAAHVSAVDVGAGQFDWGLRNDTRVSLFERTNIRNVTADDIGGPFDLARRPTSRSSALPPSWMTSLPFSDQGRVSSRSSNRNSRRTEVSSSPAGSCAMPRYMRLAYGPSSKVPAAAVSKFSP